MSDNRTVKPTKKRRQEARRQGRVAASGSLVGATSWLGLASLVSIYGAQVVVVTRQAIVGCWSRPVNSGGLIDPMEMLRDSILNVSVYLVPLLCLIFCTSVLGRLAQVGFFWVPSRIAPQADRLQPAARFVDLFSIDKFAMSVRALAVFCALGAVLTAGIWYGRNSLMKIMLTADLGSAAVQFASQWGLQIGACLFIVGLLDYAFQLYRFELSLRMTPEELRTEIQAVQENPQVGAGRRGLRQSLRQPH